MSRGRRHGPGLHPALREPGLENVRVREGPETPALSPRERRYVAAVLGSKTIIEAAAMCGIHERSLRRVIARKHVAVELAAASAAIYADALAVLRRAAPAASDVLVDLLGERPALRLAAARAILAHAAPAPAPSVAVAVSSASAGDAELRAALRALPFETQRALRAELLRRLGVERPAHCL